MGKFESNEHLPGGEGPAREATAESTGFPAESIVQGQQADVARRAGAIGHVATQPELLSRDGIARALETAPLDGGAQLAEVQRALNASSFENPAPQSIAMTARSIPSTEGAASGDFFHATRAADGTLHFFLGDVEGHGGTSGTMLATGAESVRLHAAMQNIPIAASTNPTERLSAATAALEDAVPSTSKSLAITHFSYNPANGQGQFAGAGSNVSYIVRANGDVQPVYANTPAIRGVYGDYGTFGTPATTTILNPGDTVVLSSDGLTDAKGLTGGADAVARSLNSQVAADELAKKISTAALTKDEGIVSVLADRLTGIAAASDDDATFAILRILEHA